MHFYTIEKGFIFSRALVKISIEGFFNDLRVFPLYIVIPPHHIESSLFVEFPHQPKYIAVCLSNVRKIFYLPHFIPISHFDVGEPPLVVLTQCKKEDIVIMSKIIRPTIIGPVNVTKQNEFGRVVKGNFPGGFKNFCQTLANRHGCPPLPPHPPGIHILWRSLL